ncbi:ArsR family transcriptional regulator [Halomicroarcula sp. GCM10025709]|uniref:ArsR family transcriptional regulator n=1 Tax=Haloarcula TaxID=2237 RepID=UPI0024C41AC6|nr:ArsR family transcriptional regulator [Halomicroarcula sp. YJ-61-S]
MRRSGSWQSVWDDRILEWIRENDGAGTPKKLKESGLIRVSQAHISRRCRKLAENGLLREIGNGAYVITEEGIAYLDEEYDAEEGVYISGNGPADGSSSTDAETNDV